jgi:drug/metabolite transporter (DMT)-like permease
LSEAQSWSTKAIAPLSYALGNLLLKRRPSLHPLELTTGMFLIGALVMIPASIAVEGAQGFRFKQERMLALFGLASIGTAVPALLNYVLVRATGATNVSLVMFFMPIFALAFGILLLGETINASALFGMFFIIVGSGIVSRPS